MPTVYCCSKFLGPADDASYNAVEFLQGADPRELVICDRREVTRELWCQTSVYTDDYLARLRCVC